MDSVAKSTELRFENALTAPYYEPMPDTFDSS